jgi:hypothetical protein
MSDIEYVDKPIGLDDVKHIAEQRFGDMAKAVVDIEKKVMVMGGELHADEESLLLDKGSNQDNLWGINIYPDIDMPDALEFDSMINLRPSQNNSSRNVEDKIIREKIRKIVIMLIPDLS